MLLFNSRAVVKMSVGQIIEVYAKRYNLLNLFNYNEQHCLL